MRYLKQLDGIGLQDENYEVASKLYLEIYKCLCHGCGYMIFPSEDPFSAIRRPQRDLYRTLVTRTFANGYTDEKILEMLRSATCVFLDRETLYIELESSFIAALKTRDMRERAMALIRQEVPRVEQQLAKVKHPSWDLTAHHLRQSVNELCLTCLGLGIATFEEEAAMKFALQHLNNGDGEIPLYGLLNTIGAFGGSDALWLHTYEDAVKRGARPREELVKAYEARKK